MKSIYIFALFFTIFCFSAFAQKEPSSDTASSLVVIAKNGFNVSIKIDSAIATELVQFAQTIARKLREKVEKNPETIECDQYILIKQVVDEKTGKPKKSLEVGVGNRKDFYPSFIHTVYNLPNPPFSEKERETNIDGAILRIEFACPEPK